MIIYALGLNKHSILKQRVYDTTLKNKKQAFFSIKIKNFKLFLGFFEYFLNNLYKDANMQKIIKLQDGCKNRWTIFVLNVGL